MNSLLQFSLRTGRKIGSRYEIVQPLGTGSEGEVYQIVDIATGITRAAKLYYSSYNEKSETVVWYARKMHKLRRCKIVLQYHHMESTRVSGTQILCLISDFCRGIPLEIWLARHRGKRIHSYVALQLLYRLVCGLEEIHALKEYHGDVHSQNILIQRVGINFNLRLIDFYQRGRSSLEKRQDDVIDAIHILHECIGGSKHYRHTGPEIRYVCCGLQRSRIRKKFPTMSALRQHLESFSWSDISGQKPL